MADSKIDTTPADLMPFGLIADAGDAKSLAFMALNEAKAENYTRADELMAESDHAFLSAHEKQTALLVREANGDHTVIDVMLVHAQDHLMGACLARELIKELMTLYQVKQDRAV